MLASAAAFDRAFFDPVVLLGPRGGRRCPCRPTRSGASSTSAQIKALYGANGQDNAHGFGFVDPAENAASNGSASYYAWDPPAGARLPLHLDSTRSPRAASWSMSANGNIDDPQFQWLKNELDAATARDR